MANHSSTLPWEIPWTEEPGGLQSTASSQESDMTQLLEKSRTGLPWWLTEVEKKLCITAHNTQVALVVKNLPANARDVKRHEFNPWLGKIPLEEAWQPTPVFLPGEFNGQRSLMGGLQSMGLQRVGQD